MLDQHRLPPHLEKYKIAFTQGRYTQWSAGELLSQVALGNGVVCWSFHLLFTENFSLLPLCYEPAWLLTYQLDKKSISVEFVKKGPLKPWRISAGQHQVLCIYAYGQYDFIQTESMPLNKETEQTVRNLLHPTDGSASRLLSVTAKVNDLMRLYVQQCDDVKHFPALSHHQQQLLTYAEHFITTHLDEDLPVDRISKACKISRSYLQRICKIGYGKGVHHVIEDIRMKEAARLLTTTEQQVGSIAATVSNWSFASFVTAFRRHYQMTPIQFRKSSRQKPK